MAGSEAVEPLVTDPALLARVRAGAGPRFLVIGAAKSGTTSLWAYLQQHPGIFLPEVKEPNYFAFDASGPPLAGPVPPEVLRERLYGRTVVDPHAYLDLFDGAPPDALPGEASVRYLYHPQAPARIAQALPEVRLVAVLRDPVDRLVSHYEMNRAADLEPLPLGEALDAEDDRVAAGWGWDWHYVRLGRYAEQLERYRDFLDTGQLLVVEYADFRDRPLEVYAEVCRHLGADPSFTPDMSRRSKEAYRARHRALEAVMDNRTLAAVARRVGARQLAGAARRRVRLLNRAPRVELDTGTVAALASRFRADLLHLEELLGRELPSLRRHA